MGDPQWWQAIGTVGAVAVAVLGNLFRWFWKWWRRPQLKLTYQNRDPWRRLTRVQGDGLFLYFRVGVENTGASIARGVRPWAHSFREADGSQRDFFDPVLLHWAGTGFEQAPEMHLLPGQMEFVDVLRVMASHNSSDSFPRPADRAPFDLVPQIAVLRGLNFRGDVGGQSVQVRVSGQGVSMQAVEMSFPVGPKGVVQELELRCREIPTRFDSVGSRWMRLKREMGLEEVREPGTPNDR